MSRSTRKWEHVRYALEIGQTGTHGFEDLRFVPNSLPNIYYGNINLDTSLAGISLSSPVVINAMTGGSVETIVINRKLAVIARERGLAMAVGSQMAALREPAYVPSYQVVREENPAGIVFANLGAEATVEQAQRAVDMLEANALQIHLNVMQELLMPEGDRDFRGYLTNIERIAASLPVPVIVKEVGFGMARASMRQLRDAGVRAIDVGGAGGTNFARIENSRRSAPLAMFNSWGLSTVCSLLEAAQADLIDSDISLVASGGITHGLEVAQALALGADATGMAGFFLKLVVERKEDDWLPAVDDLHHQLRIAMAALGCDRLQDLRQVPLVISGQTGAWAQARGIDLACYGRRGE